jgi:hypothetical protein
MKKSLLLIIAVLLISGCNKDDNPIISGSTSNNSPNTPSNPNPMDGVTNVLLSPTLSWTGGDPDAGDTVKYDLYFDIVNPPIVLLDSGLTYTNFKITTILDTNRLYYWRINAKDNHGATSVGSIWRFTTGENLPIAGLIAYYPFNGNANDETGNGYNGTVHSATLSTDRFGNSNKVYSFNGTNTYIEITNSSSLHLKTGFSICVWFKLATGNGDDLMISKHMYGYRSGFGLGTYGDKARFFVDSGYTYNGLNTNETYNDNQWHFMIGTFDGSSNFQNLYIDGILKKSQQAGYTLTNNFNITLGCSKTSSGILTAYYSGLIDDVRIYNRALSTTEIGQLYHEGGW